MSNASTEHTRTSNACPIHDFLHFFVCSQSELYENKIGQERIEHMAQILSKIAAQVKDEGVLPQRLFWGERVVEGAEPVVAGLGRRV